MKTLMFIEGQLNNITLVVNYSCGHTQRFSFYGEQYAKYHMKSYDRPLCDICKYKAEKDKQDKKQ